MKVLRPLLLLLLLVAVLVSSTGLTVGMHLCGGEINSFTLFGSAQPCPMEQKQEKLPPCHASEDHATPNQQLPEDCCQNQTIFLDGVDVAVHGKAVVPAIIQEVKLLALIHAAFVHVWASRKTDNLPPLSYSAPPIVRNIPVFVQSFLL